MTHIVPFGGPHSLRPLPARPSMRRSRANLDAIWRAACGAYLGAVFRGGSSEQIKLAAGRMFLARKALDKHQGRHGAKVARPGRDGDSPE